MPYQSKTYSLSDEVIAAIEQAREQGETPNKFLRRVLAIDYGSRSSFTEVRLNGEPLDPSQYSISDDGILTLMNVSTRKG